MARKKPNTATPVRDLSAACFIGNSPGRVRPGQFFLFMLVARDRVIAKPYLAVSALSAQS
jgi:hypothetical protein